jgi:thioredoxin reductase (NADPH)
MYASSEGLETVVIEREAIGGQAGQSAHIQNYLGFPAGIGGEELSVRAYEQAWQFGAQFLFANEAVGLHPDGERWTIELADGGSLRARAVIIANGISYRRLGIEALDALVGAGVFYGSVTSEARSLRGADVVVAGGGNSAGQAALHLARYAGRVVLVSRHDSLTKTMSTYLIVRLQETPNIEVLLNTLVIDGEGEERLAAVTVENRTSGRRARLPADALFVLVGARPHTAWLPRELARDGGGYVLTGPEIILDAGGGVSWPLDRPPHPLETSLPGVFAVGDVRSGSVKRVASAVGEGAVAVRLCHQYLAEREVRRAA